MLECDAFIFSGFDRTKKIILVKRDIDLRVLLHTIHKRNLDRRFDGGTAVDSTHAKFRSRARPVYTAHGRFNVIEQDAAPVVASV